MGESAEIGIRSFHDKVVVTAHEHVSMENDAVLQDCIGEIGKKPAMVCRREEDLLSFIASCGDVVKSAGIGDAERAGHDGLLERVIG
jgi:hypothetical protein